MDAEKREIEVRTLSGESTTVSIATNRTISDLKLLLTTVFPTASSSPNFHLFFKGVKLSVQSHITALTVEPGEFLVLIPFIKKERPKAPNPDFSTNLPKQTSNSSYADSVYSDMMQEFSSFLKESSNLSTPPNYEPDSTNSQGHKRKRVFKYRYEDDGGGQYAFLWSVFQSSNKNILDDSNCEKFVEVLESLNCLTSSHSGICVLVANSGDNGEAEVLCLCPEWLKRIMQAFAFLNILSAYLQMHKEEITSAHLKEVLKQLGRFGFNAGFEDIEHISVLCPKVVSFANNSTEFVNSADALVIINSELEDRDEFVIPGNGQKAMSLSKIFTTMRKRESSFKSHLWEAARLLMSKSGNAIAMLFSLEDLLNFVKGGGASEKGNEAKRESGRLSSISRPYSFRTHCHETNHLVPVEMVQHLREGLGSNGHMVHVEDIDARKAIYAEIPHELSDNTKLALKCMGITKLYSHQAKSIMASLAGKNVVVSTMTSSGKSLCYNVPVLEVLSQNLSSCALYLFPTKALAQDQLRALLAMAKEFDTSINIGIYDGDTSQTERPWLRDNARLLITNPDMLHMSILPFHRQFSRILSNLRFVVIDEAHYYKGAFGCHTALILRRLRRICSHVYGSDPSFIFSTATSANPHEHCMELANLSTLDLINIDGSPSTKKLFALWNPIVSNEDGNGSANKKTSPISEVSYLFAEMIQHGLRCIAFCKSRKLTELVLSYTREILQKTAPHLVNLICAYRGGYAPEERRKIEREFFSGTLCGIAATNALELGIDVGHIDATLHLGFPGSISSLWQQAGRSGRREKPSLAVYVAFEGPLDQYFMKHPKKLFNNPIECCHVDAQNEKVLEQHLVCAALEHPLNLPHDEKYFGSGLSKSLMSLKSKGYLSYDLSCGSSARIWSYIGHEKSPSHGICIRAIEAVRYRVIDVKQNEVLEEIEESKAFFQVYEGAVYMHQGKTYLVEELIISEKIALCRRADLQYYTKTRDYTDIHVLGGGIAYSARVSKNQSLKTTAQANYCKVTTIWFGFYRIERGTKRILDKCDLSLPKYSYESQAVWIQVPQSVKISVQKYFPFREGLHAASHAILKVVPLYVFCNYSDLAPECPNPHDTRFFPERILVYDQHPGGTGVAVQIQPYFTELLNAALELLTSCHCSGITGCPHCVQSMACHEYNEVLHKNAAIMIIKGVMDAEESYFKEIHDSSQNPIGQCQ
ncbi:uncharacterized ATP-dependent helicase YprA isoform X1 [Ricinus communis]|uniref:uncharacterized ATP-dependent helicase YprA isoform X1 n=1 Tax=Ricinus communis TaxID=3988 RepID=UPI00201B1DF5|nr:uncharacterized ATP-dependent helicase YprA isoform X1 [Ricinus communis]XP_015572043.2 uncharacterized ATP-dependent helicase YprA isoform X1 [Ricinus communis]XP_015572044.2 uncharacterized ATP-dependent helicase YprA isoform X1 [Ricinus communis]XP_015572045.2 uncharacterized ATP-dependent helicase YprA isoform X1 [Ricinus communis]